MRGKDKTAEPPLRGPGIMDPVLPSDKVPSATVAESGSKDGKPPAPKTAEPPRSGLKKQTSSDVGKSQTERARKADEELAKAGKLGPAGKKLLKGGIG